MRFNDLRNRYLLNSFTVADCDNPALILLDALRRAGWDDSEIDLSSFATAAERYDEMVCPDA